LPLCLVKYCDYARSSAAILPACLRARCLPACLRALCLPACLPTCARPACLRARDVTACLRATRRHCLPARDATSLPACARRDVTACLRATRRHCLPARDATSLPACLPARAHLTQFKQPNLQAAIAAVYLSILRNSQTCYVQLTDSKSGATPSGRVLGVFGSNPASSKSCAY
jgi:hypothetical protein